MEPDFEQMASAIEGHAPDLAERFRRVIAEHQELRGELARKSGDDPAVRARIDACHAEKVALRDALLELLANDGRKRIAFEARVGRPPIDDEPYTPEDVQLADEMKRLLGE